MSKAATKEFKLVGDHAEDLAAGQMLAPGETIKLKQEDIDDPHNARLIEEGKLLDVEANLHEDGYEEPKADGKGKED